jgi:polygalacturonase
MTGKSLARALYDAKFITNCLLDCVAVNSGSNMVFENLYCDGSHGLSIGSISSGVTVTNIAFKDSSVVNGENGCRIKTDAGDDDSTVSDVTYSNIYVENISE